MPDIFNISISGLRSFQNMLATTGHNISNVNTEGYSRQKVDLSTRVPEFTGGSYVGSGVRIASIRREYDQYVDAQLVANKSLLFQLEEMYNLSSRLDNLVADVDSGLSPSLQNFFKSIQNVSDDPASMPARKLLYADAQSLVNRFDFYNRRLVDLSNNAKSTISTSVAEINSIAKNITDLNRQITTALGNKTTQPVNDLLDQRQQLIVKLSEHVSVSTFEQDDGSLNVFIGTGQALVVGITAQKLSTGVNQYDSGKIEIVASNGNSSVTVTNQISGGKVGASLDYLDNVMQPAKNALGRIALGLANNINNQHKLGVDLNGDLGGNFFNPINTAGFGATVNDSSLNSVAGQGNISAQITSVANLTTSDYLLKYNGSNNYTLTRLSDNTVTALNPSSYPFTSSAIDGFSVTINSAATAKDTWLIQPTAAGSGKISMALSDPAKIAAAAAVTGSADLQNKGSAKISDTVVSNMSAYVADTYRVFMADNANALADAGVSRGNIVDSGNNSTLQYELRINGVLVHSQNEAAAAVANLNALATQINTQVSNTGVRAYVNAAGTSMYLLNEPKSSADIVVNETLNTTAGVSEDADTVTGYFGSVLTGSTTPSASITFNGDANSYIILNSANTAVADGSYSDGSTISFNGIQTKLSGTAKTGDMFTIAANSAGVSDNRNMLAIANLQSSLTLAGGTATFQDAFGFLVADVGTKTRQTEITKKAQNELFNQSVKTRASKSGVNLDEEAANLVRFQQAYQAIAQVVSTADTIFQTIIGIIGRR